MYAPRDTSLFLYVNVYNNIIFNISKLESYQMSTCAIIDKHTMVYSVKKEDDKGAREKGNFFKAK